VNSTTDKRLISFLVNDDFINYVLNPNLILKELWEDYSNAYPEDISLLAEARRILLGESMLIELPITESIDLENSILRKCGL